MGPLEVPRCSMRELKAPKRNVFLKAKDRNKYVYKISVVQRKQLTISTAIWIQNGLKKRIKVVAEHVIWKN